MKIVITDYTNPLAMRHRARVLFPNNLHNQRQWVRKTYEMYRQGSHCLAESQPKLWSPR